MGHPTILGFIVYLESNTYTHFMNVVLIHELVTATAMQGFMLFIFPQSGRHRNKQDKKNSTSTCEGSLLTFNNHCEKMDNSSKNEYTHIYHKE